MHPSNPKVVTVRGRYGRIQRRHLWPILGPDELPELRILSPEVRTEFCQIVSSDKISDRIPTTAGDPMVLPALTADRYFGILEICYRAFDFEKALAGISPREAYRRCSDGRHGGLLDVAPDSVEAFCDWYFSRKGEGAHPFEFLRDRLCLFVQTPLHESDSHQFWLRLRSVSADRIDPTLILVGVALARANVPFVLPNCASYSEFARGNDWIGVADEAVWGVGFPVWPEGAGLLKTEVNSIITTDLISHPGALNLVEWFSTKEVPVRLCE